MDDGAFHRAAIARSTLPRGKHMLTHNFAFTELRGDAIPPELARQTPEREARVLRGEGGGIWGSKGTCITVETNLRNAGDEVGNTRIHKLRPA